MLGERGNFSQMRIFFIGWCQVHETYNFVRAVTQSATENDFMLCMFGCLGSRWKRHMFDDWRAGSDSI